MAAQTAGEHELAKDLSARLSALGGEQQERLARHRAQALGVPYINLFVFPIDPDVLELVPRARAQAAQAVLFYKQGKDVRLAGVNPALPSFKQLRQDLQEQFRVPPQIYGISHRGLEAALSRYRREEAAVAAPAGELSVPAASLASFDQAVADLQKLGPHLAAMPPTQLLQTVVSGAVKLGASDIHIEPAQKDVRLRYRIDGVLQDVATFARGGWRLLLSRVKVLAGLKLNVHDVPQDGSFVLKIDPHVYDIRVSALPGGNGENIVMRLLDRDMRAVKITALGMKDRDYQVMVEELKRSNGMILVTGPTGSGKTTSLASFIQEVNEPGLKIVTLEDPIEYRLPGVEQTQIDVRAGYTFAKGLRAILRQDPDMVMVGEIRDTETAETAIHAALTGHLVFSTLHTNDAPGAVPRLVDMGAKPFVIAPAMNVIIAQRLVRKVCPECSTTYKPDATVREQIAETMRGVAAAYFDPAKLRDKKLVFRRAAGCPVCHSTGYRGRIGLFEVMPVRGPVEELILQGADANRLREAALRDGMTTILQDGYLKVLEGITTIDEVERVTEE